MSGSAWPLSPRPVISRLALIQLTWLLVPPGSIPEIGYDAILPSEGMSDIAVWRVVITKRIDDGSIGRARRERAPIVQVALNEAKVLMTRRPAERAGVCDLVVVVLVVMFFRRILRGQWKRQGQHWE
jgi:hypothetical protein